MFQIDLDISVFMFMTVSGTHTKSFHVVMFWEIFPTIFSKKCPRFAAFDKKTLS